MIISKVFRTLVLATLLTTLSIAQKEALLVGVSDYRGTADDLVGIDIDVANMKSLLEKWGFHTTILSNEESMNLSQQLDSYSALTKDDDFVFYYSGHGYHIKDKNGDESDGEDETLVLSDGKSNDLFLDDALYGYLNNIPAKKLIVLDSCHSGTAFKAFGDKPKPKSLSNNNAVDGVVKTKAFRPQQSKLNSGAYIVFSASQDNEESLATKRGSLFTNAFVNQFRDGKGKGLKLMDLKRNIGQEIIAYCNQTSSEAHHPNLSASDASLKYTTIGEFFKSKT
ncbi:caspase family protein, partial [Sulfurovum sp. bin170]|uniref:caspase family protein n=1 Tax=Sulfurovum sp. bin170 TaxID=2695268 RepID=UPI0013E0A224